MTTGTHPRAAPAEVHDVVLDAGGVRISGLLAQPRTAEAASSHSVVIVALHGRATGAGYFHGQAHPDLSLLDLAGAHGYTVLALDRPGYGRFADDLHDGQSLAEQSTTLHGVLRAFARTLPGVAGFFVVAHSYGGMVALHLAADDTENRVVGLDISGCGFGYSRDGLHPPNTFAGEIRMNWGPLQLYPPETFQQCRRLVSPVPPREEQEWPHWPDHYARLAPRVTVPVRFTFAEHEFWWLLDDATLTDMTSRLSEAPLVRVDHQAEAGHNISLGWAAPEYHRAALGFLAECRSWLENNAGGSWGDRNGHTATR
ncbi:alpha/beta hydrolase [Lipingzhangella sp. LS1_29]|uniref:Alpha/beta hydrolase n=1 Tax=Lipingzhangella rawalii TaxID=2055835 RepID=A0ABU2HC98_9ACTN|nr:alpha/beta hydrolase [Lipingzhangella rawalii]MDS1272460.1 alpha/beta hydrolase [Lipingzhangella rawalii]